MAVQRTSSFGTLQQLYPAMNGTAEMYTPLPIILHVAKTLEMNG